MLLRVERTFLWLFFSYYYSNIIELYDIIRNYMGVKGFNLFNSCIIISVMSFLPWLVANLDIKEYPLADSYFDRIYVIRDGSSVEYLHAYCKESNVLSLSLTSAVDFEEEPRFPIYPPNH